MSFDKIKSCGQSAIGFLPIVLLGDFNAHFNYVMLFRLVLSVQQPTVITALSMVIYISMNKNPNLLTERSGNGLCSTNN